MLLKAGAAGLGAVAGGPLLAGCSEPGPDPQQSMGTKVQPQVTLGPEVDPLPPYPQGYVGPRARQVNPFHDGSTTFKIVVPQNADVVGDWNDNEMTTWFQERTGVKVKFQGVLLTASDGSPDLTKVNAMIASGDLPDAFMGIPFTDAQISLYGSQGLFQPLQDHIQTQAPAMQQVLVDYPDLLPYLKSLDGKIYQFKALSDCYHCHVSPSRAWVNRKYLDAVGGQVPTTPEELRELLLLFKDQDPSGTGKMLPFAAGVDNNVDAFIMNAFLYNPSGTQTGGWMRLNNEKVEFVADKPEWREALRYLRTLNQDGTLGAEAFTMTGAQLLQAGNQGRIGFARCFYQGSFIDVNTKAEAPWRDYVAVPPLKGPGGVQYAAWDYSPLTGPPLLITNKCTQPEVLVQWADNHLDLVAQLHAYAGEQGKNWDWGKQGETGLNGKQALFRLNAWPAPQRQSWYLYQVYYLSKDFRLGQYSDPKNPDLEKTLFDATAAYEPFAEPREMHLPRLIFSESAAGQQADTAASIQVHMRQTIAEFATGKRDINSDADWQNHLDTLGKMGLTGYLNLYQEAYDSRPR